MSPQWRDEIDIVLSPRRVALRRLGRGVRPRRLAEVDSKLTNLSLVDWRPALAALRSHLSNGLWDGACARVTICDHWSRYAIVPWSFNIWNEEERLAHGRSCLTNVYGDDSQSWRVSVSEGAPGKSRVVCALPEELLVEIRASLAACRSPLICAQPHLVAAYNKWRARLPESHGWFVTIDEGSLAAARLVNGGWDRVYSARIGSDWSVELQRLKVFGSLVAQDDARSGVYVDAPSWLREVARDGSPGVEWLVDEHEAGVPGRGQAHE